MEANASTATKARRRILSCSHCRRLKSRCEYDPRLASCQRCHKLRIDCSLKGSRLAVLNTPDTPESDSRLAEVENSLASLTKSVDRIFEFLQRLPQQFPQQLPHQPQPLPQQTSTLPIRKASTSEAPSPNRPHVNAVSSSAPIAVVRTFRPKVRRLYEQSGRDVISQGILSEDLADCLIESFISRLGQVVQAKTVSDLTTAPSIRQASPLLHAVCCLQALRFFRDVHFMAPAGHRQLYEEVRRMLGQVVLATPIPIEELYALLIMCTYEAAPQPVFEYIESWHLSGICAQQAVSAINFDEIVSRLGQGYHDPRDKQCLSLWNSICLVHLRFAVGTGKLVTIPSSMLGLCSVILDHPGATTADGLILAEIELFLTLSDKTAPPQLGTDGRSPELTAWEQKWGHLLDNALHLRFAREFAYLVLAMRLVERFRANGNGKPAGDSAERIQPPLPSPQVFQATAHRHALAVARIFLAIPTAQVQELPKFHHICIAYCSLVLAECADHSRQNLRDAVCQVLGDVCTHYRRFADELPAVMNVALAKMRLELPGPEAPLPSQPITELPAQPQLLQTSDVAALAPCDYDFFDPELGVASFLTVDGFFGNWMLDAEGL